jgi:CheY-like chemotaxis protein
MKKKQLKKRLKALEQEHLALQRRYNKLEEDKLSIYNLLYRVNRELDEALANKQTFISSMSHELRSPLTAVLGNATLLAQTGLSVKQEHYLNQLNESADFLMALLADLLDVSKLKESKIELNIQETHLDKLLLHCANMVESKVAKEVEFNVNIPTLPYYAFLDKKRVQQIFINLLTNAAKFTKKGKIDFSLLQINQVENLLEVIVEVTDTGSGIPEKIKETLFEPFTSTDANEGTGLGLYISHELVSLMDGKIEVVSERGKGTRFLVTFFCEKSSLKMRNLTSNTYVSKEKEKKNYEHLTILIVEDIEVNREFLKEMFKVFFSVKVDCAENGKIAVEKVQEKSYDIVFMDMRMPVMDGLEATKEIRRFNKELPIVCMSANVYREDKHEAELVGMNDFIEKPLEISDIESKLKIFTSQESPISTNVVKNVLQQMALKHFQDYFDEESSLKFIKMAEDGLRKAVVSIEKNLSLRDCQSLRNDFHGMKGILSNLGLEELTQKATLLQNYAEEDDFENIEKRIELFLAKVGAFFN